MVISRNLKLGGIDKCCGGIKCVKRKFTLKNIKKRKYYIELGVGVVSKLGGRSYPLWGGTSITGGGLHPLAPCPRYRSVVGLSFVAWSDGDNFKGTPRISTGRQEFQVGTKWTNSLY